MERELVKNIERVGAVVHEVDAHAAGYNRQTEETARSGRGSSLVEEFVRDLSATRCGFHDSAIVAVHCQDVAVGGDGHAKRVVESAVRGDIFAGEGSCCARNGVWNRRDAVVEAVGHVQRAVAQSYTSRANHQRCRVGATGEAGANYGTGFDLWIALALHGNLQVQAHDRLLIDDLAASRDRAVENIGHEEISASTLVKGGHIPGAIDGAAREGFYGVAPVIQHDQTASLRGC